MDSLTDTDIDRIFVRVQSTVDLSQISSKNQFETAVKNKSRNWNKKLNTFYWDRINDERKEFRREIDSTGDISEIRRIKKEASKNIDVETLSYADEAISTAQEVRRQEKEILEIESGEILLRRYREAKTVEEIKEARRELREELPYSLRSIKGWETRYGQRAFRQLFGED